MRTFDYDPARELPGLAQDVARHAWSDFWAGRKAVVAVGGSQVLEMLQTVEARDDLVRRLDDEFDRELLDEAMTRVRVRVTPRTWEAFDRTALQGRVRSGGRPGAGDEGGDGLRRQEQGAEDAPGGAAEAGRRVTK